MHLILDIGNTNTKLAVFEANDLKALELVEGVPDARALNGVVQRYPEVQAAILSSVVTQVDGVREYLQRFDPWVELRPGLPLPIQNAYDTPE
ncbi:MAG: type III pantothenate kinase, partial [Bacteroidota bacterium]